MVLKQIAEGAARSRTSTPASCPTAATRVALDAIGRVFELREFFEWRGLGSIDHSGVRIRDAICALRRRAQIRGADTSRSPIPKSCQCGEVLKGVHQALGVQGVRQGLHAGDAARRADGFVRRCVRRLLPVWRRGERSTSARTEGQLAQLKGRARDQRQRSRPVDGQPQAPRQGDADRPITLAHGGGGKAMHDLIDDVFVRGVRQSSSWRRWRIRRDSILRPARARRPAGFHHRFLRRQSARVSRAATSASWQCAARSTTWRSAARVPLYLSCAVIIEEGLPVETLRRVAAAMAATARAAGVQVVTGDTKVVERGACDKLFINTAGIGVIREGRRSRRRPCPAG